MLLLRSRRGVFLSLSDSIRLERGPPPAHRLWNSAVFPSFFFLFPILSRRRRQSYDLIGTAARSEARRSRESRGANFTMATTVRSDSTWITRRRRNLSFSPSRLKKKKNRECTLTVVNLQTRNERTINRRTSNLRNVPLV